MTDLIESFCINQTFTTTGEGTGFVRARHAYGHRRIVTEHPMSLNFEYDKTIPNLSVEPSRRKYALVKGMNSGTGLGRAFAITGRGPLRNGGLGISKVKIPNDYTVTAFDLEVCMGPDKDAPLPGPLGCVACASLVTARYSTVTAECLWMSEPPTLLVNECTIDASDPRIRDANVYNY